MYSFTRHLLNFNNSYRNLCLIPWRSLHELSSAKKSYVHGSSTVPLLYETLGEKLRLATERFPDREFVIFKQDGVRRTYQEVLKDSENLATGLFHLGLNKGDRLGIWSPNHYEWVVTQFAAALAGLILVGVNVNPMYMISDLSYAIDKVGIKALIAPPVFKNRDYYSMLLELIPEMARNAENHGQVRTKRFSELEHLIIFDKENRGYRGAWKYSDVTQMGTREEREKLEMMEKIIQPDDPVNIQYTSGTTGNPKGATLTHHNIVNNAYFLGLRLGYDQKRFIICCPPPLYHCFGCVAGTSATVIHQQTCVFPAPSADSLATLKTIDEERCTTVYGTPTMFIDLLNHAEFQKFDVSSVNSGIIAGAPCPPALLESLMGKMNMHDLVVGYGSTELSPLSHMSLLSDPPKERVKSVGNIMDHVECMLVDQNDKIVPIGQKGEVLVRGYGVMQGYWNHGKKTDHMLGKWYRTGDIGIMHGNGALSIVGRSKDMIVRGGENIYPTEIENFLIKHPEIQDVHIIGIPDERFGEAVCAWIRLNRDSQLTGRAIKAYCKDKIAHYKIPKYILFKKEHEIPQTVTGKVQKFRMREISIKELGLDRVESHLDQISIAAAM